MATLTLVSSAGELKMTSVNAELHEREYYEFEDDDGLCDCDHPDSWESACIDDLCHGGEVPCMHGDYAKLPCPRCNK